MVINMRFIVMLVVRFEILGMKVRRRLRHQDSI